MGKHSKNKHARHHQNPSIFNSPHKLTDAQQTDRRNAEIFAENRHLCEEL